MKPTKQIKPGRRIRSVLIILLTLIGAMVVALAIVPNFIPWNKIKLQAEEKLSTTIHHRVSIDRISFNPIKGIELAGVTIANREGFSKQPLLIDEAAIVKYRLLPILMGKIVVKALVLKRPQLLIEKHQNGQFNFSDMMSKSVSKPEQKKSQAKEDRPTKTESSGELPFDILVAHVGIEDATLIYHDLKTKQEFKLEAFNFKIDNLTLAGLTPITVLLTTKINALGKSIPVKFKTNLRINYNKEQLELDSLLLDLPGLALTSSGKIEKVLSNPFLAIRGETKLMPNTILGELLPEAVVEKLPEKLNISGPVSNTFKISGAVKDLKSLQAEIYHELDLTIAAAGLPTPLLLKGKIDLTPTQFSIKSLQGILSNESLTFSLNVDGFDLRDAATLNPENLKTRFNWTLNSKQLDLGALLAIMPKKKKDKSAKLEISGNNKSTKKKKSAIELDASQLIPKGLVMNGQASLGGCRLGKVALGALTIKTELINQVSTSNIKLLGYQGEIVNKTQLSFEQPTLKFITNSAIAGVDLEPLMKEILDTYGATKMKKPKIIDELKDKMTGRMTGQINIKSKGMNADAVRKEMTGFGQIKLLGSRLRRLAFQQQLANWFGNEKFNQDLPFDQTTLEFTLNNELVTVTNFVAQSGPQGMSGDLRLTAEGDISFGAKFKNFRLNPRVNERAAKNISADYKKYVEVLKDEHGWVALPMVLNGPLKKPVVKPDWEWINRRFKDYTNNRVSKVAGQAKKKAESYIKKQTGQSTEKIKKNIEKELKKLNLNNLFK